MTTTTQELIDDFRTLVEYTAAEIASIYSFGEPDFDPVATAENAAANLADRYARLTGLSYDEAMATLQRAVWGGVPTTRTPRP